MGTHRKEIIIKKREMASTVEKVSLTNNAVYYEGGFIEIQALDEKVRSFMQKSQNLAKRGNRRAENTEMKNHIEANHLEGFSIPCNYCEKTFRTRNGLRHHKKEKHVDNE